MENEFVSDGSMEHFYRMFKAVYPNGTIKMFHDWFRRVCEIQDQMAGCPWCGVRGSLMVMEYHTEHVYQEGDLRWHAEKATDPDRLLYYAKCENLECTLKPEVIVHLDTPEEARDIWNARR